MFLKSIMFQINYRKLRNIAWSSFSVSETSHINSTDSSNNSNSSSNHYNPYDLISVQGYNPIYDRFFTMSPTNYNQVCFDTTREFLDPETVVCDQKKIKASTHIKFAPLLDPIHYLIGKYDRDKQKIMQLPDLNKDGYPKICNPDNASYVDCFFNFLCSKMKHQHNFPNAIDFYGSYLAIQKEFLFDATDDFSYLQESEYFRRKRDILYRIEDDGETEWSKQNMKNTHSHRPKVSIEINHLDVDIVDENSVEDSDIKIETSEDDEEMEMIYHVSTNEKKVDHESDSEDSSNNSVISNSSSDDDDEDEDEDEDNEDDEEDEDEDEDNDKDMDSHSSSSSSDTQIQVFIKDFPVQLICMEKCDGTLDQLLVEEEIKEHEINSALSQIIFSLLAFQKSFDFTHNDLHTNNIVYVKTDAKFIVYTYQNIKYYVPTYGRLFKMIDFGRAIFKFQDKLFCSDSFAEGGDAHTQYNFPPYWNPAKPAIHPNPSFDLCRLGCSMFDFVFEEDEDATDTWNMNRLQKTVLRWCIDDMGKNILYKKNGDERYPNFKLYKMIARYVHNHTPEKELQESMIQKYTKKPKKFSDAIWVSIDALPVYWV